MGILTSLLLFATTQAAVEPVPAIIHTFGDWSVACDNGNRCQAVSLVPESPKPLAGEAEQAGKPGQPGHADFDPWERFGVMRLEREAGANAPLSITIFDFEGTPAKLRQYDDELNVRFEQGPDAAWRMLPADQTEFLDRFYSEPIVVLDAAGKTLAWIATAGASGAMSYMDERQGRVRTTTALAERGLRPAAAVPPPPPIPVVTVAPRTTERPLAITKAQLAEARRRHRCQTSDVGGTEQQEIYALGNGRSLVMMSCGSGAYNFSAKPLIAWRDGRNVRIEEAKTDVPLREWGGDEPPQFLVTNAEFDPATMRISGFAKGRGLGDCGVAETHAWDGERFRLVEQNEMHECRGTLDLLTTWRVTTR